MLPRRLDLAALVTAAVTLLAFTRVGAQNPTPDIERGRHVVTVLAGCTDCHGASLGGGRAFARDGVTVVTSNLTTGAGGIAGWSDAALRAAIRQGVAPDGTVLRVMPWREYAVMTDADVDDVIAYLRSLPPVDDVIVRAPAAPAPAAVQASVDAPQPAPTGGAYLARIGGCMNCHGANLAGTNHFGYATPNITHDGIGAWSFADFQTTMKTGVTPAGHVLDSKMPWEKVGRMTDAELRSLYDYLESQRT